MNSKHFQLARRIAAAILLSSICAFAFASIRSTTSGARTAENSQTPIFSEKKKVVVGKSPADTEESRTVTLKTEKRGFPLLNLQDVKSVATRFVGADGAARSFDNAQARPLTMANADLNHDGAGDLVVGYAGGAGGYLALYAGNPDSLSARTPEVFEEMKEGRFPAPFLSNANLIELPIAPDFVGAGDFNRDGWKDIVAAESGDNRAFLLIGNSRGGYTLSYVEVSGQVTAMLVENIDLLDNAADIAFAVNGERGASLLIYNGAADAFGTEPEICPLPAAATSLAIGQLDDDEPMDILVTGGGKVAIIHGAYPENGISKAGQVEILNQGFDVAAARVGNFVWDRDNRPEIALLGGDGSVRILERASQDKRPLTEAEL